MTTTLRFRVHLDDGTCVGALNYAEDAAILCGGYGDGATIRVARRIVWRNGDDHDGDASESADHVREVVWERCGIR
jgi:hypothetical protein